MSLQLSFKVPGQEPQVVPIEDGRAVVGTLLSNQIVLRAPGIDPIHALIEQQQDKGWCITDLGSSSGVRVNGQAVTVEAPLKVGDKVTIGSIEIKVEPLSPVIAAQFAQRDEVSSDNDDEPSVRPPAANYASKSATTERSNRDYTPVAASASSTSSSRSSAAAKLDKRTVSSAEESEERREKKELLFSPRHARPSGDVLEVVAYWGDTVLDVELFHPRLKGFEKVTIGDPTKAHFIAAGTDNVINKTFASVSESGYGLRLLPEMEARVRVGGRVEKKSGPGSLKLGRRDVAHVKYGPVSYFFLFVRPPSIRLPRSGPRDPVFTFLMSMAFLIYFTMVPVLWYSTAQDEKEKDDIWSLVQIPKKEEKPPPQPKQQMKIVEVKTPPPEKKPPPPKPKEPEPAKPIEKEKPKQTKPVEKPVEKPLPATASLNQKQAEKPKVADVPQEKPAEKSNGMASTDAKSPDFKRAGPKTPVVSPNTGGAKGSGMNQAGGERKGNKSVSVKGVEGVNNDKPSGVNLSKLGIGVGKILDKTGPGAINTNFKNSAGGLGGGSGSGSRTVGFGGIGGRSSLGLAGSGGAVNNFGSGSGGLGSGEGGTGGLGGTSLSGVGGGRGRADVNIPAEEAVTSGGLTREEILSVIRTNLNQIRHCYEQLLQRSPKASGKLTVTFVINDAGRVATTNIESGTISDSIMRGCVTGKIARWAFPRPRGTNSVNVKYPFVFSPL